MLTFIYKTLEAVMNKISLNGKWQCECVGLFKFDGEVPGSTINDLINADKLPKDLLSDKNADEVLKYENCDFNYTKTFNINKKEKKATLVFERLDTYVDIYFNGVFIGHRENGNIEHRFDISDLIQVGDNTIELKFKSCITTAKPVAEDVPYAFTKERLNIRRMQCTFGWDWTARFVCSSIGNVSVLFTNEDEIMLDAIYAYTKNIDEYSAEVGVDVNFNSNYEGRIIDFEIVNPEGVTILTKQQYCDFEKVRLNFNISNPKLWYPTGYGEQPLYEIVVKDNGKVIHKEKFGIRTIKILQVEDAVGSKNYKKCLEIKNKEYDNNKTFSGFTL